MNDINKKQMKDVIVPHNDLIRRPIASPEPFVVQPKSGGRIDSNPFFEKKVKKNQPFGSNENNKKKFSPAPLLWALGVVVVLGAGFAISNYFASATISIVPITRSATLDTDISATKEVDASGGLTFKFMSLVEEQSKDVAATIEKNVQTKASGRVLIYNSYSGSSQRLIKNTRLEDDKSHKIFRIDTSVVVPGATMVKGVVTVPGSVEAVVYADVAGKEYNIGTSNFTIPGFKGDPRYTKFTAASKPDSPIGGGFSGTVKVPSDEAVLAAQNEIKQGLMKTAVEKARAQVPEGVSFFPGSTIVKYEEVPQEFTTDATSKISVRATISVFFFDTELLTQKLTEIAFPDKKDESFHIPNMTSLVFKFVDPVESVVLADLQKLKFHISGLATFVGNVDTTKISSELAGKDKKDFGKIIGAQSNIEKADLVIRPVWRTVFPADPSRINSEIVSN